jgi:hypothetical protein
MGGVLKAAQYIDFGGIPVESVDKFYQFARRLSTVAVDKYGIGQRKMEAGGGVPPPYIWEKSPFRRFYPHIHSPY